MTGAAAAPTPAHLFIDLWRIVAALTPSERSNAAKPGPDFHAAAAAMAAGADPVRAAAGLAALIDSAPAERTGRQLGVMRAIDSLFEALHPRIPRVPGALYKLPDWMRDLADHRLLHGCFVRGAHEALVARGPLLRTARDEHASFADSLADRFCYLGVVPLTLSENGRPIAVKLGHVGMDMLSGVMPIAAPGEERILFVPVAEGASDLDIRAVESPSGRFAHYAPADALDAAGRLLAALDGAPGHDIALAPELVTSPEQSRQVANALRKCPSSPRVLLLGTQHSDESEDGQRYNEAVLVNAVGTELWRQRKLWPAEVGVDKARMLQICCPVTPAPMLENNAAGREIHVIDMDGFGRAVVLICQDTQLGIAAQLVEQFQPDWVLVPVLDSDLGEGRWAHSRTFTLSQRAQSRFVAVTSTVLGYHYGKTDAPVIGMAIGPAHPESGDEQERAAAFILAAADRAPASGSITWRGEGWTQSRLVIH